MEAAGQPVPADKPTLEINLHHPLINQLSKEENTERCADLVALLYDQAVLSAGDQLDNPGLFVRRLNQLLFEGAS